MPVLTFMWFPFPDADVLELNSTKEAELDRLILAAAGLRNDSRTAASGPSARLIRNRKSPQNNGLRRSVSMKASQSGTLENRPKPAMSSEDVVMARRGSLDDLDDLSSAGAVPPCPPLRGEGYYSPPSQQDATRNTFTQNMEPFYVTRRQLVEQPVYGTRQEPIYTVRQHPHLEPVYVTRNSIEEPLYVRRANPAPRPPQRTVSFMAADTLPRKMAQVTAQMARAAIQQRQHCSVSSDTDLYGQIQRNQPPPPHTVNNNYHNRSNSSPAAPLPQRVYNSPPLTVTVAEERDTDSPLPFPLPPPPYISPPAHRANIQDDLPLPPPPPTLPLPPPPPVHQTSQPRPPCDSASSSSSIDSGYARSKGESMPPDSPSWMPPPNLILSPESAQIFGEAMAVTHEYRKPGGMGAPANYAQQTEAPKVKKTVRIRTPSTVGSDDDGGEAIRRRQYRVGLNLFNLNPEHGIEYLLKKGFLDFSPSAVAKFMHGRKGLSKNRVGDYMTDLRKPFNLAVLHCFMHECLDFSGLHLDIALRQLQQEVTFPGEAQKIEKMVEVFSRRYIQCNQMFVAGFRLADTIFVLSYAVVLLNTDLHSRAVRPSRRMRRDDFVKNLRGVDSGADLDEEMLEGIYDRIKANEFKPGSDHVTQVGKVDETIIGGGKSRTALAADFHRRLVCFCRLTEVPDLNRKEKKADAHQRGIFLFNDVMVVTKTVAKKNKTVHQFRSSLNLADLRVNVFSISQYQFGLQLQDRQSGKTVLTLNARSRADQERFVTDLQESVAETEEMERATMFVNQVMEEEESLC
jgi:hypothetical protein